jgi:Family of unknown function (DUF6174)
MRTRSAHVLAAVVLTALALTGCSDDGDDDTATDPGGSESSSTPTAAPTVGSYPAFGPADYEYTLTVSCFCPDAGVPVRVTVADGSVTSAVYDEKGSGFDQGDPAPDYRGMTINGVIDEVNAATDAATVRVKWPEGQDYPSQVWIDQDERMADEEIGYTIADVEVG